MKVTNVLIVLVALAFRQSDGSEIGEDANAHWSYKNQSLWGQHGKFCKTGGAQSPINLVHIEATESHHEPLHWRNNMTEFGMVTVENGGHGFSVSGVNFGKLKLGKGGLAGEYRLAQFHYHWGLSQDGSEHRVDGEQWAAEIHLVHYHTNFLGVQEALDSGNYDALAVVGVLLTEDKIRKLSPVERMLKMAVENTLQVNQSYSLDMKDTTIHDFLPNDLLHFYRYYGSLTTPGCIQQVVWTVMKEEVTIPREMIDLFAKIKDNDGIEMKNTARDVQLLKGRKVYRNEDRPHVGSASSVTPVLSIFVIAVTIAFARNNL